MDAKDIIDLTKNFFQQNPGLRLPEYSKKMILVTNNGKEFERVPGLQVENWVHH
jgi:hypothetical protein